MRIWDNIKTEFSKGRSAVHQIVLIILAVFIFSTLVLLSGKLFNAPASDILNFFYLPSDLSSLLVKPWTIVTNIFFHSTFGIRHALGNVLAIYFIGRLLEDFMSTRRMWTLFLGGGISGSILFVALYNLLPTFEEVVGISVLLGASGGVAAILAGAAIFIPYYILRPFGIFEITMRNACVLMLFIMLTYPIIDGNLGGFFAHLGGAIFGSIFILNLQGKINIPKFEIKLPQKKAKLKTVKGGRAKEADTAPGSSNRPKQEEVDAILDKISNSGYDSLTKEEKELLFKASE
ncbi:MAG: rhomboid family intramembrane serine protease [Bacteroidia bacterium]